MGEGRGADMLGADLDLAAALRWVEARTYFDVMDVTAYAERQRLEHHLRRVLARVES